MNGIISVTSVLSPLADAPGARDQGKASLEYVCTDAPTKQNI